MANEAQTIQITCEMPEDQARAFAQFLKRAGHGDYLRFTRQEDDEEAYRMLYAADKLRESLEAAGIAPR